MSRTSSPSHIRVAAPDQGISISCMTSVTSTEQPDTNSCVGLPDILWKSWESNARSVIRPRFGSAEPRKQKHDRRDADLILKLLVETAIQRSGCLRRSNKICGLC